MDFSLSNYIRFENICAIGRIIWVSRKQTLAHLSFFWNSFCQNKVIFVFKCEYIFFESPKVLIWKKFGFQFRASQIYLFRSIESGHWCPKTKNKFFDSRKAFCPLNRLKIVFLGHRSPIRSNRVREHISQRIGLSLTSFKKSLNHGQVMVKLMICSHENKVWIL